MSPKIIIKKKAEGASGKWIQVVLLDEDGDPSATWVFNTKSPDDIRILGEILQDTLF